MIPSPIHGIARTRDATIRVRLNSFIVPPLEMRMGRWAKTPRLRGSARFAPWKRTRHRKRRMSTGNKRDLPRGFESCANRRDRLRLGIAWNRPASCGLPPLCHCGRVISLGRRERRAGFIEVLFSECPSCGRPFPAENFQIFSPIVHF